MFLVLNRYLRRTVQQKSGEKQHQRLAPTTAALTTMARSQNHASPMYRSREDEAQPRAVVERKPQGFHGFLSRGPTLGALMIRRGAATLGIGLWEFRTYSTGSYW